MEEENLSYLSFRLNNLNSNFAIHVGNILEIREFKKVEELPGSEDFVLGVVNYQNAMVPIIDGSAKLGGEKIDIIENSSFIIFVKVRKVELDEVITIGFVVDSVSNVFEINHTDIKTIDSDYSKEFIIGTYTDNDSLYLLLDIQNIFSNVQIIKLSKMIRKLNERGE